MSKLKIVKSTDPLAFERAVVLIYGDPGAWKSSISFSSFNPLMFDFDHGAFRALQRGDSVQVDEWSEVSQLTRKDLASYDTIVIDTVGRALDMITAHIIADDPRKGNKNGGLSMQGWGVLKGIFTGWIRQLQTQGKDIVMIAHGKEDKQGDTRIMRPDIQGGSYGEVLKVADMVGILYRAGSNTVLDFSPTDRWIGKNAPGLEPIQVPNLNSAPDFLGTIIQGAKDALNERNHASSVVAGEVGEWRDRIHGCIDPEELTEVLNTSKAELSEAPAVWAQVRGMLNDHAKHIDLIYNPNAAAFERQGNAAA